MANLETCLSNIKKEVEAGTFTRAEASIIRGHLSDRMATAAANGERLYIQYNTIKTAIKLFHDATGTTIDQLTTADAISGFAAIRNSSISDNYKRMMVWAFRCLVLYIAEENPELRINVPKIKGVKTPAGRWKNRRPEDMLTKDEVNTVIAAARKSRDRAFLALLYDGSNRPSEALALRWGDLHFDEYGCWFDTAGKTGKPRHIRLTTAVPYLAQWKADYPGTPEGPAFVFCPGTDTSKPMTRGAVTYIINDIRARTGITKLTPYVFRPSRITHDVSDGYETGYISLKNWGTLKTPMLDVYTNVSADYLDGVALERAGMGKVTERVKAVPLKPRACPRCGAVNGSAQRFCGTCACSLTDDAAAELERAKRAVFENPDLLMAFLESIGRAVPTA